MNVIIDSNVVFSALIKDSKTRNVILSYEGLFLFPSYIFEEIEKHIHDLYKKTQMSETEFKKLLQLILTKVVVVPKEVILPHKKRSS